VSRLLVLSFVMALVLHALVARVDLDMGKGPLAARKVPRRLTMALVKPRPVKKFPDAEREKITLSNTDKMYPVTTGPRQRPDLTPRVVQERDEDKDAPRETRTRTHALVIKKESPARTERLSPRPAETGPRQRPDLTPRIAQEMNQHKDAPRETRTRTYALVIKKESPARAERLSPRPAYQDEDNTVVLETTEQSASLVPGKGISRSTEERKRPEEPLVLATPDYQKNAPPPYPLLARKRNYQGTVLLEVLVKADGTAGSIRLSRSSGHETLDRAAIKGVSKWLFQPATKGHEAIDMWVEIPIRFELK
jgi:protein TonB